jgi:hypothetical protein
MRVVRADVSFEGTDEILTLSGLKSDPVIQDAVRSVASDLQNAERYQECDEVKKSLQRNPMVSEYLNHD